MCRLAFRSLEAWQHCFCSVTLETVKSFIDLNNETCTGVMWPFVFLKATKRDNVTKTIFRFELVSALNFILQSDTQLLSTYVTRLSLLHQDLDLRKLLFV